MADSMLDPYSGNRLAHSSFKNDRREIIHFLAFPSGETGTDLSDFELYSRLVTSLILSSAISPFHVSRDKQFRFISSATPALSFDTPIQQVEAFLPRSGPRGHCEWCIFEMAIFILPSFSSGSSHPFPSFYYQASGRFDSSNGPALVGRGTHNSHKFDGHREASGGPCCGNTLFIVRCSGPTC